MSERRRKRDRREKVFERKKDRERANKNKELL